MFKDLDLANSLGIIGQCDHYSVTAKIKINASVPVSRAITGLEERRAKKRLEKDIREAIEKQIKKYPYDIDYKTVSVEYEYSDK